MKHYAIFTFYRVDTGANFEVIGANFKSRGLNHAGKMASKYCRAYIQKHSFTELDYKYTIYHRRTNPNFEPNQLKVYRGKISGCVSRNVASEFDLQKTDN